MIIMHYNFDTLTPNDFLSLRENTKDYKEYLRYLLQKYRDSVPSTIYSKEEADNCREIQYDMADIINDRKEPTYIMHDELNDFISLIRNKTIENNIDIGQKSNKAMLLKPNYKIVNHPSGPYRLKITSENKTIKII